MSRLWVSYKLVFIVVSSFHNVICKGVRPTLIITVITNICVISCLQIDTIG